MELANLSDTEILRIANPIMDNLMEGFTEINHEKHTRDFTGRWCFRPGLTNPSTRWPKAALLFSSYSECWPFKGKFLMQQINEPLRQEILAMAAHDLSVREELMADGSLAEHGYHPRMEEVHQNNAVRLATMIEQHGWPGKSLVGEDGAEAAWLIAQHSIGNPSFMRRCLSLLQKAASQGEVLPWQPAMLEDRIRMFEGKPQIYGSQFQLDENGKLVPYTIENPDTVNERRCAVGLNSLEERMTELKVQANREKIQRLVGWEDEYEQWLHFVGWRK